MKIAIRNGESGWKKISNADQEDNSYLRDLIQQIPDLIPVEELIPGEPHLRVCIRNLVNGSEDNGSIIGVDDNGRITIVECKTTDDSSFRREIMGRAMAYAMDLWEMSYEEFDSMVFGSEGKSLAELMSERVPVEEWSEERFKNAVVSALQEGKFRLIVSIPKLTEQLKRTINFLNARGPFSLETYAVEMQHFSDGQTEIVIPKVVDLAETRQRASTALPVSLPESEPQQQLEPEPEPKREPQLEPESPQSSEADSKAASFFSKCEESVSENVLEIIRNLYAFSMEAADSIMWWGRSFNFALAKNNVELTVFSASADGNIAFPPGDWQEPSYSRLQPQFLERLKGISVLGEQEEELTRWSEFNIEEVFAKPDDFVMFREAVNFLKEAVRELTVV